MYIDLADLHVAMTTQDPTRLGLVQSGENLIGQISGPNATKVGEKVEEVKKKWAELEVAVETRTAGVNVVFFFSKFIAITAPPTLPRPHCPFSGGWAHRSCGGAPCEGGRV